jgi:hypothetical protein
MPVTQEFYGSASYRPYYDEMLAKIIRLEEIREAVKRRMAFHWERKAKDQHAACEAKIRKLDDDIHLDNLVWFNMPPPKKRRPRKSVLVDGIRTKLEYAR